MDLRPRLHTRSHADAAVLDVTFLVQQLFSPSYICDRPDHALAARSELVAAMICHDDPSSSRRPSAMGSPREQEPLRVSEWDEALGGCEMS